MKRLAMAACVAVAIAGCGRNADPNHLTVAGSTAFTPVVSKVADAFKKSHAEAKIDIQSVGSMVGIKNLTDGVCDIAMGDLPEVPAEAKEFKAFELSRDGIAVIVNPKNGVSALTMEQVGKIFSGEVTNWKDVGGADGEITVVVREENSGSRKVFDKAAGVKGKVTSKAQAQTSSGALRTSVSSTPGAIGYLTMVQVDSTVKALTLGGAEPTIDNVKSGKFPIFAIDYFFTKGEPTGLAKEFIDFTLSPEGQKLIKDAGLIPAK